MLEAKPDARDAFPVPPPDAQPFGPPCPGCGRARTAADAAGVTWSSRHAADGAEVVVEFVCPACTRAEIAQIETGLPTSRRSSAA
jgi:hypothetical protein